MSENGNAASESQSSTEHTPAQSVNNTSAQSVDQLPQWAQKEIRELRDECAQRRQKVSSLESDLQNARNERSTAEAGLNQRIADSALELARYRAAVTSGIPVDRIDDFASRLRGSNAEELETDARSLAQLFQTQAAPPAETRVNGVDPSQGRGNGDSASSNSLATELQSQVMEILGRVPR